MKEREFIELLNLYLDHEIGPADAARLEQEIQRNPERRRTYREYCRMQKACRMLATEFAGAPALEKAVGVQASTRLDRGGAGVEVRWRQWVLGAGGVIAAASLAMVVYLGRWTPLNSESAPRSLSTLAGHQVVNESTKPGANQLSFPMVVSAPAVAGSGLNASLVTKSGPAGDGALALSFSRTPRPGLRLITDKNDQLDWIRQFQLVSVADRSSVALPRFEVKPNELRPDVRAIRLGTPAEPAEEAAAFRFLK